MTDAQAATVLVDTWYHSTLACNDDSYIGHTEEERTSLEKAIAAALAAERRAVWLEANKLTREMAELHQHTLNYERAGALLGMLEEFEARQQAEGVKP